MSETFCGTGILEKKFIRLLKNTLESTFFGSSASVISAVCIFSIAGCSLTSNCTNSINWWVDLFQSQFLVQFAFNSSLVKMKLQQLWIFCYVVVSIGEFVIGILNLLQKLSITDCLQCDKKSSDEKNSPMNAEVKLKWQLLCKDYDKDIRPGKSSDQTTLNFRFRVKSFDYVRTLRELYSRLL